MHSSDVFTVFKEQDFIQNKPAELTDCDREPIHMPGSIQPHGVLLVLDDSLSICQLSENVAVFFHKQPETLLQQPLAALLGNAAAGKVAEKLKQLVQKLHFQLHIPGAATECDAILHRSNDCVVLELEIEMPQVAEITLMQYGELVQELQLIDSVDQLYQKAAEVVKKLTGFDRVLVYKFHDDSSGEVVGEAREAVLESFLGLHFPATDIPKQARLLYLYNPVRLISDVNHEAVRLLPQENPVTNKSTNLSFSSLRAVSPIHIQYLKNMGVQASMSISIVLNGRLWGLFACHNTRPLLVPYTRREACYLLGRNFSTILRDKLRNEEEAYLNRIREVQAKLFERISDAENYTKSLYEQKPTIKELITCSGCVICFGEVYYSLGETPAQEQVRQLAGWLQKEVSQDVYSTSCLSSQFPEAAAYKEVASGVLAIAISRIQQEYIMWFRKEAPATVAWAGKPEKAVQHKGNGVQQLAPRQSFATWVQQVQGTALPWSPLEVHAVREMRSILVDVVMRVAGELKLKAGILARLNRELEQSNNELDSFAYIASHDLKEPLRGIYNYSQFLLDDYADKLDSGGKEKLNTLIRLSHRMEHLLDSLLEYSRVGRMDINKKRVSLAAVLEEVKDLLRERLDTGRVEIRVVKELPVIFCDETQVSELFQNLIVNAIKYNKNERVQIEVGWAEQEVNEKAAKVFYVKDNGIGIEERHFEAIFTIFRRLHARQAFGGGTGVGLTIVKKVVERHGGAIWVDSVPGKGTTFYFTLEE